MTLDGVQSAIYALLKRFIQRQQLVYKVIKVYRPHLVGAGLRSHDKAYIRATYKGQWGKDNEWNYYLHGGGCRLTHTKTLEPIEWDASDLLRIDPYWFSYWVEWALTQEDQDEAVTYLKAHIDLRGESLWKYTFEVLAQLSEKKLLDYDPNRTNKYRLVVTEEGGTGQT